MKENAAETCASQCRLASADESLLSAEEPRDVKTKQEYDACYSKCVAQETKEVAEEREKVGSPYLHHLIAHLWLCSVCLRIAP